MKTLTMERSHDLRGTHHRTIALQKGETYKVPDQVSEADAKAVEEAGAGKVTDSNE